MNNKDIIKNIQSHISTIREGDREEGCNRLNSELKSFFKKDFNCKVIPSKSTAEMFILSVVPNDSTITKICSDIVKDDANTYESTANAWKNCNEWNVEIDEKILIHIDIIQDCELTAILLHQIYNVVFTDAIPRRINNIIKYAVCELPIEVKAILQTDVYNKFLELPIRSCCTFITNKADLKENLRYDMFRNEIGYIDDLLTGIERVEQTISRDITKNTDQETSDNTDFTINMINSIKDKDTDSVKETLGKLNEVLPDNNINESVERLLNIFDLNTNESSCKKHINTFVENVIEGSYVKEFFDFRKKLKPITPNELDYIDLQIENIKNINDKMMIVSYINSKLDMCRYYIEILENKKASRKYNVPHTKTALININNRLVLSKKKAIAFKIPEKKPDLVVYYPRGYEG